MAELAPDLEALTFKVCETVRENIMSIGRDQFRRGWGFPEAEIGYLGAIASGGKGLAIYFKESSTRNSLALADRVKDKQAVAEQVFDGVEDRIVKDLAIKHLSKTVDNLDTLVKDPETPKDDMDDLKRELATARVIKRKFEDDQLEISAAVDSGGKPFIKVAVAS